MKVTMKRLMQKEEWKTGRDNLEGELFILNNGKCETEEKELSAPRTRPAGERPSVFKYIYKYRKFRTIELT